MRRRLPQTFTTTDMDKDHVGETKLCAHQSERPSAIRVLNADYSCCVPFLAGWRGYLALVQCRGDSARGPAREFGSDATAQRVLWPRRDSVCPWRSVRQLDALRLLGRQPRNHGALSRRVMSSAILRLPLLSQRCSNPSLFVPKSVARAAPFLGVEDSSFDSSN
jgi:hypothetical protein